MQGWVLRWLLNILAIILTAALLPGFDVTVWGAIVGSIFLGVINAIIRPILLVLTLPLNIMTLGLFTLVINGFMLWLTAGPYGIYPDWFWLGHLNSTNTEHY